MIYDVMPMNKCMMLGILWMWLDLVNIMSSIVIDKVLIVVVIITVVCYDWLLLR